MKRVIKFRAWDGVKMQHDEPGFYVIARYDHENCMQFTGLHDKNGKEIYEGDVLSNGQANFKVVFSKGMIYGEQIKSHFSSLYGNAPCVLFETLEIIGNIHENPELIQTKQDA